MVNYILKWKHIEQPFSQTMHLSQYGDTIISSINTHTTKHRDYSETLYKFGNSINSYGNFDKQKRVKCSKDWL